MKSFFLGVFILLSGVVNSQLCPVIPSPGVYTENEGRFVLAENIKVDLTNVPDNTAKYLKDQLIELFGVTLEQGSEGALIQFENLERVSQEGEYSIKVDDTITITFSSEESCFHAVVSFLQLIQVNDKEKFINRCSILDAPNFSWRGLHLDVSRHFFSKEEVKRFIDLMAVYKFNALHWHLTDDQGWRLEIKKYPLLTEVGAYRDSTLIGHYSDKPRKYEKKEYGGFYTQEEVKEIVSYAQNKYINVVPEIEMPGHSRAALAAYPELSCTKEKMPVPGLWGIFDDIYCSRKESVDFMKDVLSEVVELFPSEYIHIGGDEAPKVRWKKCKDCQRVIEENDLADEHELQSYFIRQIDDFLAKKGRKLIGWDEILEGGLSPNAAVMSWRGEKGGIEAARQGHSVVMSPTTYCYFDYYQSSSDKEPVAIGGYLPLEKVYQFNPIPNELSEDEGRYILGGQANLWTEYIPDMKHLEYMTYPRALAISQSVWCENKPDYDTFLKTYVKYHEGILKRYDVNYSKAIHYPQVLINREQGGISYRFKTARKEARFNVDIKSSSQNIENKLMSDEESIFVSRAEKGEVLFTLRDELSGEIREHKVHVGPTFGIPVELTPKPHLKYNHNGSLNLVDGVFGGERWKGSEWLGFQENQISVVLDLEEEMYVEGVRIGFLDKQGSWIYIPESVQLEASLDKVKWQAYGVVNDIQKELKNGRLSVSCEQKVRYVRLGIQAMDQIPEGKNGAGHIPWTFIDEIELIEK